MHSIIKAISLAAFMTMCSACSKTDTSSSKPTDYSPKDGTQAKKVNSDKAKRTETRSAESHSHGDASLAIVLEGSTMTVELDTPIYNLLGFEHIAETAKQKIAVQKAELVLSNSGSLFVFNSHAECKLSGETIRVELGLDGHEDHDDHEDHEDDQEEDHDEHEEDDAHDKTHKDVTIRYNYKCSNPQSLKSVRVNLFEHFENLTKLDLVYLGPNTQKQVELSATKTSMILTR